MFSQKGYEKMIIGVGVDIVKNEMIQRAIDRHGSFYIERIFTESEIFECEAMKFPVVGYACYFSAKESLLKAIGTGWSDYIQWLDVEVCKKKDRMSMNVYGSLKDHLSRVLVKDIWIAVSWTKDYSTSMVILEAG